MDTIRDITAEHLGPEATEADAAHVRDALLAMGYSDNTPISRDGVTDDDWEDAVRTALEAQR